MQLCHFQDDMPRRRALNGAELRLSRREKWQTSIPSLPLTRWRARVHVRVPRGVANSQIVQPRTSNRTASVCRKYSVPLRGLDSPEPEDARIVPQNSRRD